MSKPGEPANKAVEDEASASLELEAAADQAIEACGGDLRETVKALIIANGFLEPGMQMITKPFAIEALATRIRDMIEKEASCERL